jgi:hypothetical protein
VRRILGVMAVVCVVAAVAIVAAVPPASSSSGKTLFEFDTLVGVSGAFLGPSMPLRGIAGGGFPWVLSEGKAKVTSGGVLHIEVEGLVIDPNNATAQEKGIAGVNPVGHFFATLSCLDATGAVVNINSAPVPATATGNASIEQNIPLPATCFAPIVLVRGSPTGAPSGPWFAASGF